MLKGCVDLLAQAASRRFMLRGVLVEFFHLAIELVDLLLAAIRRDHAALVCRATMILVLIDSLTSLERLNLPLHIGNLLLESLIAEQLAAHLGVEFSVDLLIHGCILLVQSLRALGHNHDTRLALSWTVRIARTETPYLFGRRDIGAIVHILLDADGQTVVNHLHGRAFRALAPLFRAGPRLLALALWLS